MAKPDKKVLSLTCYWISGPDVDCQQYLPALRSFFTQYVHLPLVSLHISELQQKSTAEGIYEDAVQYVTCQLEFAALSIKQLKTANETVISQWCHCGLTDSTLRSALQWLVPDCSSNLWNDFVPQEHVSIESIAFGSYIGLCTFAEVRNITKYIGNECMRVDCVFKHDQKLMHIYLTLQHKCGKLQSIYRLLIKYDDIYRVVVNAGVEATEVYLHVKTLPLLHRQVQQSLEDIYLSQGGMLHKSCDRMRFERTLNMGCSCTTYLQSASLAGCSVLKLHVADSLNARRVVGRLMHRCRREVMFVYAPAKTKCVVKCMESAKRELMTAMAPLLQFPCQYALNVLLQRSNDVLVQMTLRRHDYKALLTFMQKCAKANESALEQVFLALYLSIENACIFTLQTALPALFVKFHTSYVPLVVPDNCCWVRRMIATPSSLILLPPEVHGQNRVLRSFDPEYALRVTFRDDNHDYLSHTLMFNQNVDEILEATVASVLRGGVIIAGRHYRYLGSSASQLRDHGVWLYTQDGNGKSVQDIRAWIGDVHQIPNVGYKMARMGQCFSSTEETVHVPLDSGVKRDLPDIVGGKHPQSGNPYVFSDGIGMISRSLIEKACKQLGLEELPSAIQIRYAGYKGVLCMNPELQGDQLLLRESMRKFHCSTSDSLEIVQVSAPRTFLCKPAFLK